MNEWNFTQVRFCNYVINRLYDIVPLMIIMTLK